MKILITGATGYIGKKLARKLTQEGHLVTAITRNKDKLIDFDFPVSIILIDLVHDDLTSLDLSGFDIVYNCSGELKNESLMQALHVDATMKLLQCIPNQNTRWVQLSSVGVYGRKITGIVNEDSAFSPVGRYEVTKAEAEIKVKHYCLEHGIPFSILRPSNVFSVDMPNDSLRQLVRCIQKGFFFYMHNPDKVLMNYVHVDGVVDALKQCGLNDSAINNDYIVSDLLTQKEFVDIVCKSLGKKPPKLFIPYMIVRFFGEVFSYIPMLPNLCSKIDALSTTVSYSTDKIEVELGHKAHPQLSEAIFTFSSVY